MSDEQAKAERRFRHFRVIGKTDESNGITSFTLAPFAPDNLPPYRPGQYLVLRLTVDGNTVLRNYSLCGDPDDPQIMRIAVKREVAPAEAPKAPPGRGSTYMHDQISVGDVLPAAGPLGDFCLDEASDRPVVLLSGGVGVTPVLSMLHRLVNRSTRPVYFIHACDNGSMHAFKTEVEALAACRPGVHVHFCYRQPTPQDHVAGAFHSQGLVGREQLQSMLPLDDYDFYLCGPSGFMQVNWHLLRSLGVTSERIHYEFFGPATVFTDETKEGIAGKASEDSPQLGSTPGDAGASDTDTQSVRFLPMDVSADWDESHESLLDLAESVGLAPAFNCRAGLCNTCMSTLMSGQVEYSEPPLDDVPEGKVLLCCSRPVGPVMIVLDD